MEKTIKALTPVSLLLRAVVFIALGIGAWAVPGVILRFLRWVCVAALVLSGVPAVLVSLFQRKMPHPHSLQTGAASLAAALILCLFPGILSSSIPYAVGLWSMLVGVVQVGCVVQLIAAHEKGKARYLILACFSFVSAWILLSSPQNSAYLQAISGLYLVFYGLWQLVDMIGVLVNRNVESNRFLSRIRVKLPVILTAMLPSVWLRALEKEQSALRVDRVTRKPQARKTPTEDRLTIFFHLGRNVAFGFGHVDVSINGRTISYGCYDEGSNRLFGLLSDGVFMEAPTKPYLQYCREKEGKLLVSFTLALTPEEAESVRDAIRRILRPCRPWKPDNRPEYQIGARFYKVQTGSFALYNALTTNCAAMAELIASESGLNLLPPGGFVTPGAYFSFLSNELREPESNVVAQTIYATR